MGTAGRGYYFVNGPHAAEREGPPPPVMTTQTLERVSDGEKKKEEPSKRPRSALPPAYGACAGATCGLATATVCSETRLRTDVFRRRKCLLCQVSNTKYESNTGRM